ncbi:MAG: hypothetical protein HXK26_00265 [Lancefieldella rimae]|uniref:Uncharacterized protein n=1 Tax=Lancefieldella rimae TaxID=1383 RepID=A0A930VYK7_9ACTN|nr:hypothetical protein [Lancefieldella rimae]
MVNGFTEKARHEVIENLLSAQHKTYYNEEIVEVIKECIGLADPPQTFREPEDIYTTLAYLIDPDYADALVCLSRRKNA